MCVARDSYTTATLSLPISLDSMIGFNQAEGKVQFGMHRAGTEEVVLSSDTPSYTCFKLRCVYHVFLHKYIIKIFPVKFFISLTFLLLFYL